MEEMGSEDMILARSPHQPLSHLHLPTFKAYTEHAVQTIQGLHDVIDRIGYHMLVRERKMIALLHDRKLKGRTGA